MRKYLLFLTCMIPFVLLGKETKKIVVDYLYPPFKEIFYVLKSDTIVRHGPYKLVLNGKILVEGSYKMGMKDSLWIEHNVMGKLRFRGYYTENKRVGIWEFNNENGEAEQQLDFTNNQILMYRSQMTGHTFRIHKSSDSLYSLLDRPPLYLGGASRIKEHIADEILAPLHKTNEKFLGTVFVEFTIDSLGKTSNHHILRGMGPRYNEEALRVVKSLPDEWFPGILNEKTVSADYVIPVIFDEKLYEDKPALIIF